MYLLLPAALLVYPRPQKQTRMSFLTKHFRSAYLNRAVVYEQNFAVLTYCVSVDVKCCYLRTEKYISPLF